MTLAIIIILFAVQSRGNGAMSALFGPVTLIWFTVLAIGGVVNIVDNPSVLAALSRCMQSASWQATD